MASVLSEPYFHDEQAAFEALEGIMWPGGRPPACPHCGNVDPGKMNRLAIQTSKPCKRHPKGKPVHGLWKCYACRGQFTVRKGTVFEESRLELHLWFQAAYLICASKKGVSANQLHRTLGVTLKTAWYLAHRLREAMADAGIDPLEPALRHLRTLSEVSESDKHRPVEMRLWVKKKPTAMSADIGRVIAEDWRTEYSDFGTVEGRLETIQDNGTLLIYVRDPLFSSSVRCYFDEDLLPQVFECFRKRVEITGTIHYRRNGTPTSIEAASITPLPDDSELPSADDVRGIFGART